MIEDRALESFVIDGDAYETDSLYRMTIWNQFNHMFKSFLPHPKKRKGSKKP